MTELALVPGLDDDLDLDHEECQRERASRNASRTVSLLSVVASMLMCYDAVLLVRGLR